jgi:hypothetical protein
MELTMLVAIGKGIELDVDPARFNAEVTAHVMKIGLRNILMDSHANAAQKADPANYVAKSRELAEKKLASMYDGIVRVATVGSGIAKPTDPVAQVILRLARKAVQKDQAKEIAALPKSIRLAALNKRAMEYATAHDAALRPRAVKIVELENDEPEPVKAAPAKPAKRKAA